MHTAFDPQPPNLGIKETSCFENCIKMVKLVFQIFLQVLDLMREVAEDKEPEDEDGGNGSDISGYHSDSESAVMTSGNSPFISKEARYSFLSRSGKQTLEFLNTFGSNCTFILTLSIGMSSLIKSKVSVEKIAQLFYG